LHVWEIFKLFDKAKPHGVKNLIVNHPMYGLDSTYDAIRDTVGYGTFVEQSACLYADNRFNVFEPYLFAEHSMDETCPSPTGLKQLGSDKIEFSTLFLLLTPMSWW
jgi:hypothetical protein